MNPRSGSAPAFRALERALLRRGLEALEPVLRVELAVIAALVGGFAFWQTRLALDFAARAAGAEAALAALAVRLGALAAAGAALAGARHAWTLRAGAPGPAWLALPVPPGAIAGHLRRRSALHALWVAVPALALLAAGAGPVPAAWLAGAAAAGALAMLGGALGACRAAEIAAAAAAAPRPGLPGLVRALARAPRAERRARVRAARFTRGPAWRALLRKDARVTRRPGRPRVRALAAGGVAALAALAWALPAGADAARVLGFGLSLLAAGLAAEWLLAAIASDPAGLLRALPVGLGTVWGARAAWAAAIAALLAALQAPARGSLEPVAAALLALGTGLAALALGLLATHLGLSLYPREDEPRRLFGLAAALALAASWMFPLLGWAVLLGAVLLTMRRVPRWRRPEVA